MEQPVRWKETEVWYHEVTWMTIKIRKSDCRISNIRVIADLDKYSHRREMRTEAEWNWLNREYEMRKWWQ